MSGFNGKLDKVLTDDSGGLVVSFTVTAADRNKARKSLEQAREWIAQGKDNLQINVGLVKRQRSLSANAYFHLLVDKIATRLSLGNDEVKHRMVLEYGTVMTDSEGAKVGVKLPASVDVECIYPYAKWFDERKENGKLFNCYIIYKQTHTLDSAEMARLIDGTVHEAQALGIETLTPEELSKMISLINNKENRHESECG